MQHDSRDVGTDVTVTEIGEGYTMFVDEDTGAAISTDTVIDLRDFN